jgi:PAS domain S-box-containing protein
LKIKTKLQLIIIVNILLLTGIVSASLLWQKQAGKQLKQQALVMELNQAVFERARLREEYFIYREERSKEQFLLIHKQIGGLLERVSGAFTGPDEKASLLKMTGFQSKIERFFDQLVRLDQSASVHTATTQELRERIISQMLVNAHSMYDEGLRLLNAANEKTVYQNNLYHLYSNILFGLLALFIAALAVIIIRGITYRLTSLHKGTEIIAEGNLDYKTNIRTPDEIGQLSSAFDAMMEHLKEITVSRDALGKEIERRRQVEEALRESEKRFKNMVEATSDWIWECSNEGLYTYVSPKVKNLLGYEASEVLGKSPSDLMPEEEGAEIGKFFAEKLAKKEAFYGLENTNRHKDGHLVIMETSAVPVFDEEGLLNGYRGIDRDITERKQTEEAIKRSEDKFSKAFNVSPEAIAIASMEDGRYIEVNDAFLKKVGFQRDEVIGRTSTELNVWVDMNERRVYLEELSKTGSLRSHEVRYRMRTGELRDFLVSAEILELEGKQHSLNFILDITDRKRADEAMKRSEEAALRLAEETGVIAEVGRIISSSLDIEEVYERFAGEVRKLIPFDLILINLVNQQEGVMTTAYASGMEVVGRRKGVAVPITGSVTEQMIPTGAPILFQPESVEEVQNRFPGLLLSFQAGLRSRLSVPLIARGEVMASLTVWSKQEKAYGERDIGLVQGVASQIAGAIANAQLFRERKQADKKIRASLKEKEVLLKEIHHRVKNNLQVVSSLLYLQSTKTKHPEAVSALRESRDRVKSMALIHERLYQSPNLAGVDMGKYTRNLVSDLQYSNRTEDSSVRLRVTVGDIPLGITEAIPCGLIINELVTNALKHAFPKGKPGEITIQLLKEGANQITLTVSDNGIGLPEHVDFRQSPSLGLSLVNSLVEQLNGTIELDRRGGTAFVITFKVSG